MNFENYKSKIEYPDKQEFITVYIYKNGETLFIGDYYKMHDWVKEQLAKHKGERISSNQSIEKIIQQLGMVKQDILNEEEFSARKTEYGNDTARLLKAFEEDCLEKLCLTNHPYSKGMFAYAWNAGHGSGLVEVYNILSNMAEYMAEYMVPNK